MNHVSNVQILKYAHVLIKIFKIINLVSQKTDFI